MTAIAEHRNPVGKTDIVDTWRERGRMPVPNAEGHIVDLHIVSLYETTAVNGRPFTSIASRHRITRVAADMACYSY